MGLDKEDVVAWVLVVCLVPAAVILWGLAQAARSGSIRFGRGTYDRRGEPGRFWSAAAFAALSLLFAAGLGLLGVAALLGR